ncbi:Retrotransposon gag domain-containing 1 [Gossypium australe]|uniref:Retrotransposon gag domain-containing 1 n=1 Tax=Gossypium australe TaxID=47621 RepID=A0A5B6WFZ8_9ROSI|nr:Retrotransposon gag domain-containing 1 [Gossypium australe]
MKCVASLLRDFAYQWWNTLVLVVPRERITWEFFQEEFQKKYISQIFIDQKRKEFLELKPSRMTVTEYEREFVRLSKYTRECVSSEAIMCKRFEDGLNEDIRLFVGVPELKEFIVLVDRACKAEELVKKKRKAEMESRDSRKRQMNKSFQSSSKTPRDFPTRSATSASTQGLKLRLPQLLVLGTLDLIDWNVHCVADITPVSAENMRGPILSVVPKIILLENAPRWLKKRKFRVQDREVLLEGDNRDTREVERVVKVHPESRLRDLRVERLRGLMPFTLAKRRHSLI